MNKLYIIYFHKFVPCGGKMYIFSLYHLFYNFNKIVCYILYISLVNITIYIKQISYECVHIHVIIYKKEYWNFCSINRTCIIMINWHSYLSFFTNKIL